jgi:hypothetical protein
VRVVPAAAVLPAVGALPPLSCSPAVLLLLMLLFVGGNALGFTPAVGGCTVIGTSVGNFVGSGGIGETVGALVVVVVTGNGVGGARGAKVDPVGTDTDCGAGTKTGLALGTDTGVATVLSIQIPSASKPTQSLTNRLEQSKYGKNSVSDTVWIVQELHLSLSKSKGVLGFATISQTHVLSDLVMLLKHVTSA